MQSFSAPRVPPLLLVAAFIVFEMPLATVLAQDAGPPSSLQRPAPSRAEDNGRERVPTADQLLPTREVQRVVTLRTATVSRAAARTVPTPRPPRALVHQSYLTLFLAYRPSRRMVKLRRVIFSPDLGGG